MYSTAIHELGHVLGFGLADSFKALLNGRGTATPTFVGVQADALYGKPVPIEPQIEGHWDKDVLYQGKPTSMDPFSDGPGVRTDFSALDYAGFDDFGWDRTTTSPPTSPPGVPPTVPPGTPLPPFVQPPLVTAPIPNVPASGGRLNFGNLAASGGDTVWSFDSRALVTQNPQTNTSFGFGGSFVPFPGVAGTVRASVGDVNADGTPDFVYVTGPGGGAKIRIINGKDGTDMLSRKTADLFPGENLGNVGVNLALGDVNGDRRAEIVISADNGGGARVQAFNLVNGAVVQRANFFGIDDPNFRGGARIALGDVNNDGTLDLVVGAGMGGGPRVSVYDGRTLFRTGRVPNKLVNDFFAFEPSVRDGVYVAAGDVNGDGYSDIVVGGGPNGGPRVEVLSGRPLLTSPVLSLSNPVANFFAYDPGLRGGAPLTVKDVDGDNKLDIVVGSGANQQATLRVFRGADILKSPTGPTLAAEVPLFGNGATSDGVFVG